MVTGAGGASNYSLGDTTRADPARKFVASRLAFAELDVSERAITVQFVGIAPNQSGEPVVLYEYARRR